MASEADRGGIEDDRGKAAMARVAICPLSRVKRTCREFGLQIARSRMTQSGHGGIKISQCSDLLAECAATLEDAMGAFARSSRRE